MKRQPALQPFLRKLKQKKNFNKNVYDKLYPSGSAPACVYGVILKCTSFPLVMNFLNFFRLLIGTFDYDLAHFLSDLLSPVAPDDYSWKDTFSFVSQIKNENLCGKFIVSYHVTSLFSNIPLPKTIDIKSHFQS